MFYVYLTIFAAAIVAVDQWTKALAAAQLTDVVDVLIPGWLENLDSVIKELLQFTIAHCSDSEKKWRILNDVPASTDFCQARR